MSGGGIPEHRDGLVELMFRSTPARLGHPDESKSSNSYQVPILGAGAICLGDKPDARPLLAR